MSSGRIFFAITVLLLICIAGPATAASIVTEWKERIPDDGSAYVGLMISSNSSMVFAGGNQMYVRTWDDGKHWGGLPATIATMSEDGNYVVYGQGNSVALLNKDGTEKWFRFMGGTVRAVAISYNGSFVVSADSQGYINSWSNNGDFYGRNQTTRVKHLAISPMGNLVVATSDTGLWFMTKALEPVWSDTKNGSVDNDIIISHDGSTIITIGGRRISSHTNTGQLNWMNDVTKEAIISSACSYDCSVIVIGSQDKSIQAIDRYGTVHWTYPVGEWVNSVAVSQDAKVIAAAGIDQNLYVLNHGGNLQVKKKMDTIIHPRSLAVSADGKRIVVADEYTLYGLTLSTEPEFIEHVTVIPTTVRYTDAQTPVPTTETTIIETPVTSIPVTPVLVTTTPKSAIDPVALILAIGTVLSVVQWVRKR